MHSTRVRCFGNSPITGERTVKKSCNFGQCIVDAVLQRECPRVEQESRKAKSDDRVIAPSIPDKS
jgi:hypothetical protein